MSIFTIADLHLSFSSNKPMGIFGQNWENHEEKIKQDWLLKVKEDDIVILPGDFSWGMYLNETIKDFEFINGLPGKKILLKGNHDYWWTTVTNMRNFIKENNFKDIDFLHNNSYEFEDVIIAGTKGYNLSDDEEDKRLTRRETVRLELSIKEGIVKYGSNKEIMVFMHYPPITKDNLNTQYVDIMKKYNVKRCYYGHLHAQAINEAIEGEIKGIQFYLVSADKLDFTLLKIM